MLFNAELRVKRPLHSNQSYQTFKSFETTIIYTGVLDSIYRSTIEKNR